MSEDMIASNAELALLYARAGAHHKPKITPVAEKVLVALAAGAENVEQLVEATGYTRGQVLAALDLLAEVGFIEAAD